MRTKPQQLFLVLFLAAMMLAGCVGNSVQSDDETADPAETMPNTCRESSGG